MGKASITINVGALWNGGTQLDKVTSDLKRMEKLTAQSSESTTRALALQGKSWEDLGTNIYDAGTKIATLGDSLVSGVTEPMAALGSYCVDQAKTFDTALANLNKTADLTADELQRFGQNALDASTKQPVTADTILNAEALGAQLGISNDNLESFASTVTGLDIATDMNVETAATQLAQFANIMGMSQSETENYGSTIVDLGNHLAATESNISNMALRLAGVGTAANFSSADVLGMAGAMSSLGIKAEAGGSAMTRIVSNISKAVANGSDAVEEYARVSGMSAEEFSAKWREKPVEAIEALVTGMHDLNESGTDVNVTLEQLGITNIRDADLMRRLAGQSDTLKSAVDRANQAWQDNTALTNEVGKRNESLESRFQTLTNKATAAATEVGTVLADALLDVADAASPVIDGIGDMAKAFQDMDPSAQTAILALAGIVAAAGPVLSVSGRVVQVIGNVAKKFGDVQSSAAVFGDALQTVDGSQMRVYNSSKSLASQMGIAGNAAAEAAGGAENYVRAWEDMTDAAKRFGAANDKQLDQYAKLVGASDKQKEAINKKIEALGREKAAAEKSYVSNGKLVSQWSGSTAQAEKAADGIDDLGAALDEVREDFAANADAATKTGGALATVKSAASGVTKTIGSMAAGFLKATAATAAITLATAAIGYLVEESIKASEHQKLLANATQSAASVMGTAKSNASSLADAIGSVDLKAEETTQKLADLNASVSDTFVEFETSSAKLDGYVSTIDQLANKSNLTSIEQYRLSEAVKGYNEVTGDSLTVTDAQNGKLSDSSGRLQENTDQIHKNADAWRKRAEAEAYSNVATKYIEAQIEAEQKLKTAKDDLTAAEQRRQELEAKRDSTGLTSQEIIEYNKLRGTISDLNGTVEELSADYQTATQSAQYFGNMAQISASNLSDGIKQTLQGLPQSLQSVGVDVANSLAAGIDAGKVTSDDAARFLSEGVATSVAHMPEAVQPYGIAAAEALAKGIGDGSVSVDQATAILSAAATGDLGTMSAAFSAAGVQMPQNLANAISANATVPSGSVDYMKSLITIKLTNGDLEAAAAMCGGNIDQGLADAINNGTLSEEAAAYLGEDVVAKLNEGAGCHSPSVKTYETGSNVDQGFANGITENQGVATDASTSLGDAVAAALGFVPTSAATTGSTASSNFASGIGSAVGAAASNAAALASNVTNGVSGTPSTLSSTASSAGQRFAANIGNYAGAANANARMLADNAKSGAEGWNSYSSGSHLGNQFASGIGSAWQSVKSFATSLVNAAKSVMGFSVPDDGPWSGAERGGVTSGMHLAQNFAAGIRAGIPAVQGASLALATAADPTSLVGSPYVPLGGKARANVSQVTNNYTVNIDGRQLASASPHAQELIAALFDEFGASAEMGVM